MRRWSPLILLLAVSVPGLLHDLPRAADPPETPARKPDRHLASFAPVTSPSAAVQIGERARPAASEPWVADQLLVAPPEGETLHTLAARIGATVVRDVGRSGWGVIEAPDAHRARRTLTALGAQAAPHARVLGAGRYSYSTWGKTSYTWNTTTTDPTVSDGTTATDQVADAPVVEEPVVEQTVLDEPVLEDPLQQTVVADEPEPEVALPLPWTLDAIRVDGVVSDVDGFVVAILDSGVAYEDHEGFAQAPGLSGVSFVTPADFVELDGHPNDDHQHGTHIASIIASEGRYPGVAPGVSLMPVKVLDGQNSGTEWALVEGIHHAVDNGADVINMSLSFPLGYVPSPALTEALERAYLADIVLVGAAGNDGAREIAWPAASRLVVAVGASNSADRDNSWFANASYSNVSPALDLLAPGGSLDADENGDGFPDGIVAETIDPADPSQIGLWMYEGTSQAAAMVSGAVVHLLAADVHPRDVAVTLQQSDGGYQSFKALFDGSGASPLDLRQVTAAPTTSEDVFVGLLPYVSDWFGFPLPQARVVAVDELGAPMAGVQVIATVYSDDQVQWKSCSTDWAGACVITAGMSQAEAWAFRVETVVAEGRALRPSRLLFASEASEVLLDSIDQALSDDGSVATLAVHWSTGDDPELGVKLLEAWSVVDSGTGLLSSPLGLLFLPRHVDGLATEGTVTLDPDGTGLLSSPLGLSITLRTLTFDGLSIAGSQLADLQLIGLDGSGLLSSPLGFHGAMLYARPQDGTLAGTGLLSSPLGFRGQPILMDLAESSVSLAGTATGDAIQPGGLLTAAGYEPAQELVGTSRVAVGLADAPTDTAPSNIGAAVFVAP